MEHLDPEYLCLFHAITETIEELDRLKADLMAAQRRAEELFFRKTHDKNTRPSDWNARTCVLVSG